MAKICMVAYTHYERDPRVRRAAEALVGAGHSVDVIALRQAGEAARGCLNGVGIIRVPLTRHRGGKLDYVFLYGRFFILATAYLSVLQLRRHYDLVHVHTMPDFLIWCGLFPKLLGKPLILDVHDPMPEVFDLIFAGKMNPMIRRLILFQERVSHRFPDQLITVHEGMRKLLVGRGVRPERLEVIHNLPDRAIFGCADLVQHDRTGFTLVYAGTVSPIQHLDLPIQALAQLKADMPDLCFRVIGEGPDIPRLKSLAHMLEVEAQIDFVGVVSLVKVPELLAQCDAAVICIGGGAISDLAFPNKAVEAFTLGLPLICSRVATMLNYFDESMSFYFDPSDVQSLVRQICLVRSDPALVAEKVKNGKQRMASLNWDLEKTKLFKIVDHLCPNS